MFVLYSKLCQKFLVKTPCVKAVECLIKDPRFSKVSQDYFTRAFVSFLDFVDLPRDRETSGRYHVLEVKRFLYVETVKAFIKDLRFNKIPQEHFTQAFIRAAKDNLQVLQLLMKDQRFGEIPQDRFLEAFTEILTFPPGILTFPSSFEKRKLAVKKKEDKLSCFKLIKFFMKDSRFAEISQDLFEGFFINVARRSLRPFDPLIEDLRFTAMSEEVFVRVVKAAEHAAAKELLIKNQKFTGMPQNRFEEVFIEFIRRNEVDTRSLHLLMEDRRFTAISEEIFVKVIKAAKHTEAKELLIKNQKFTEMPQNRFEEVFIEFIRRNEVDIRSLHLLMEDRRFTAMSEEIFLQIIKEPLSMRVKNLLIKEQKFTEIPQNRFEKFFKEISKKKIYR